MANYGHTTFEYHPLKIVRELDSNIPISETEAGQLLGLSSASTNESTSRRQPSEQSGQQRQTPTPPGVSRNSQQRPEIPQDPPPSGLYTFSEGLARFLGNVLGNITVDVNVGSPGPGPASREPPRPSDPNSHVDLMFLNGLDSSNEGRLRYAAAHGIGGTPFSAEWGDAMLRDVKRRYG